MNHNVAMFLIKIVVLEKSILIYIKITLKLICSKKIENEKRKRNC